MELLIRKPDKSILFIRNKLILKDVNDIMRISYYSPKKNVKTFSFANLKPVLIFTEKNKESVKDRDNIFGTVKKKLNLDNINKPNFGNSDSNGSINNNYNQNNGQNGNLIELIFSNLVK